jgi:hypothetical protein
VLHVDADGKSDHISDEIAFGLTIECADAHTNWKSD